MRWGLGPVFIYECLANSRRWQTYALRSVGVAALLFAMATIASNTRCVDGEIVAGLCATRRRRTSMRMIGVELALVMLAAPAATAGAICLDRARGTLAHMLDDRPLGRGDRPGQAGRAADAGIGPGRMFLARHGDQLAAGWDRPDRA